MESLNNDIDNTSAEEAAVNTAGTDEAKIEGTASADAGRSVPAPTEEEMSNKKSCSYHCFGISHTCTDHDPAWSIC